MIDLEQWPMAANITNLALWTMNETVQSSLVSSASADFMPQFDDNQTQVQLMDRSSVPSSPTSTITNNYTNSLLFVFVSSALACLILATIIGNVSFDVI